MKCPRNSLGASLGIHFKISYSEISSTCEIVYNIIKYLDPNLINEKISTCLYTGIMTDTGSFRYSSTTFKTHKIISKLIKNGAEGSKIHEKRRKADPKSENSRAFHPFFLLKAGSKPGVSTKNVPEIDKQNKGMGSRTNKWGNKQSLST